MPEDTFRFTLTAWKALLALAIIGGWFGLRAYMNMQPVIDDQRQAIEEYLTNQYQGNSPQDLLERLQSAKASGQTLAPTPPPPPFQ